MRPCCREAKASTKTWPRLLSGKSLSPLLELKLSSHDPTNELEEWGCALGLLASLPDLDTLNASVLPAFPRIVLLVGLLRMGTWGLIALAVRTQALTPLTPVTSAYIVWAPELEELREELHNSFIFNRRSAVTTWESGFSFTNIFKKCYYLKDCNCRLSWDWIYVCIQ